MKNLSKDKRWNRIFKTRTWIPIGPKKARKPGGQKVQIQAKDKYEIIIKMLNKPKNTLSVKLMCELAKVSRSGFYNNVKETDSKLLRKQKDLEIFNLILSVYKIEAIRTNHIANNNYKESLKKVTLTKYF